jgi:hypothetical protein
MRYKEHNITTLVRTKQFWQYRLKGENPRDPIYMHKDEIKPFTNEPESMLSTLCHIDELERTIRQGKNGNQYHLYAAKKAGQINPSLLKNIKSRPCDSITMRMREFLKDATLKQGSESTPYLTVFLNSKDLIDLFFTIDHFSGRIHTPITSLKSDIRKNILLDGEETISIDVVTMQPLLLGAILKNKVGDNEFSKWIDEGKDIYIMLQAKTNLSTREDAKKKFFEILFAHSNESLSKTFGDANWITWINEFKSKPFEPNPNTLEKNHSNLAWLLQTSEVQLMRKVWHQLLNHGIKFLSVHDEVIIKATDHQKALEIFQDVLSKELTFFKLSDKSTDEVKKVKSTSPEPPQKQRKPIEEILSTIPKGKPFYSYELKEKFNLTDEEIQHHFEDCLMDSFWTPFD